MRPLLNAAALAGLAGAAVWLDSLMRLPTAFGPICGHAGAAALHCPSCYAATALALASVSLMVVANSPRAVRVARA